MKENYYKAKEKKVKMKYQSNYKMKTLILFKMKKIKEKSLKKIKKIAFHVKFIKKQ
jgi:hypothetical protein